MRVYKNVIPVSFYSCLLTTRPQAGALRPFSFLFAIGLLLVPAYPAVAQIVTPPTAGDTLPLNPNVVTGILDNGLRYYIQKNEEPKQRAELRLVINAGSILEDEDQLGLAHFVEHMAFNGTSQFARQALVTYLESIGMRFGSDINASTGFDETIYRLTIPTDSVSIVSTAFQILKEWASQISFDPEEIEKERGVVIEEWRIRRGAVTRMMERELDVLLQGSRYSDRLPIGTLRSLETFPQNALIRYYRDWYRPDLMAVVAVGDFDVDAIESLIRENFAPIPVDASPRQRVLFPVPDQKGPDVSILTDPEAAGSKVSIRFLQPARKRGTVDAFRHDIVESLYNSMLTYRLNELTRQPGAPFLQAYSYQGQLVRTKEEYVLGAGVADQNLLAGLEALLAETQRVALHGYTPAELERQKSITLRLVERSFQERESTHSTSFAGQYVNHFLFGTPAMNAEQELELYSRLLPSISLEEIKPMAQAWLDNQNRVVFVQIPLETEAASPDEAELLAAFDAVRRAQLPPYEDHTSNLPLIFEIPQPGHVVEENTIEEIGITEWRLSNGVRVFLKPTDFKDDHIVFAAQSPGGTSLASDEHHIAALTAAAIVQESGVGAFDRVALDKRLAGVAVSVTPWTERLQEGLSGSVSPQDVESLFQLIHLYILAPRFDSSAFLAYQERMQDLFRHRGVRPESAFADTIRITLAQNHWRERPWSEALFGEMDLQAATDFYLDRFGDVSDFTFFFVGAFTPETLRPLVETYLGSLPAPGRKENWRDEGIMPPKGVVKKTVRRGFEPKSRIQLIFTGPFDWKREARYSFSALIGLLQIQLREKLREELGGTYSVNISGYSRRYPQPGYRITISFGCDPQRREELVEAVFIQIDSLRTHGVSDFYLVKIQSSQRRAYEVNIKNNRYWLEALRQYDFYSGDLSNILTYPDLIASLTAEKIREAARQYFNLENYIQVVLYPER